MNVKLIIIIMIIIIVVVVVVAIIIVINSIPITRFCTGIREKLK